MIRTFVCALLFAGVPLTGFAQAAIQAASGDRLTLDLYLEFETVSEPQLSPNGMQVVYTRQRVDKINDRRESSLWIMNADGAQNRFLAAGSNARWSPDGTRLAYVAAGTPQGRQIFVRSMTAEGAATQVTHVPRDPVSPSWSPDGTQIAFAMLVEEKNAWPVAMPQAPQGGKWVDAPRIVERMRFRQDRVGFVDSGYWQIFVVPAESGTARQLTSGPYDHVNGYSGGRGSLQWTPNGREILFSTVLGDNVEMRWRESDIYAVDVASADVRRLTTRHGPDDNPLVSPDGRRVAYTGFDWTNDTWIDSKIYIAEIDGSNARLVSGDWDRSPTAMFWRADGEALYFTAQSEGTENLHLLPLSGPEAGRVQPVTQGTHMLSVSSIGAKGTALGVLTAPQKPPDVVSLDLRSPANIRQLTFVNDDILAGKRLGQLEEIWYTSTDGLKVQGWYITPPDFDPAKKYPMQLHIHGGPHSMYSVGFNYAWQEHAANGYVILYTNPRGSTGYGSAFGNGIMRAYPGKDFDDLMAGVDTMLAKGFVDSGALFVTGCSGGGVLTAWVVGHTDRFAAASSNCTIVDWVSFMGTMDMTYGTSGVIRNFEHQVWENPSEHLRRSPLMYVGNVKTPTMLMTGELDLRTPIAQAEQFYRALKLRGVPTALIRFNNEWHGTSSTPSNFLRTQLYLRHWFEKHKPKVSTTSATGDRR
jgi:dipeptidyl aminopeptidase/acylaminoacyl peptidase